MLNHSSTAFIILLFIVILDSNQSQSIVGESEPLSNEKPTTWKTFQLN